MISSLSLGVQTVPDTVGIRALYALPAELSDFEVAEYACQRQRARLGGDVLPPHLQRIIGLAAVLGEGESLSLESFTEAGSDETALLRALRALLGSAAYRVFHWDEATPSILMCRTMVCELAPHSSQAKNGLQLMQGLPEAQWFALKTLLAGDGLAQTTLMDFAKATAICASGFYEAIENPWQAWLAGNTVAGQATSRQTALLSHSVLLRHHYASGLIGLAEYRRNEECLKALLA